MFLFLFSSEARAYTWGTWWVSEGHTASLGSPQPFWHVPTLRTPPRVGVTCSIHHLFVKVVSLCRAATVVLIPTTPSPPSGYEAWWFWLEKADVNGVVASGRFMIAMNCSARKAKMVSLNVNPPPISPDNFISNYFMVLWDHGQLSVSSGDEVSGWRGPRFRLRVSWDTCTIMSSPSPGKQADCAFCCWLLSGKTITLARTMDIPRSVQNFRFFASSMLHHTSECTHMDHLGCLHYTVRAPVGIGGCSGKACPAGVPRDAPSIL